MLKFERFGSTYAAQHGTDLYVVSFHGNSWIAYIKAADMDDVGQIGGGHATADGAMKEAQQFAVVVG